MKTLSPYLRSVPLDKHEVADFPGDAWDSEVNLRDYWLTIRKHSRLILAVSAGVVVLTTLIVFVMTPVYTSECTLLIERNAPQALDIRQLLSDPVLAQDDYDYYKTQYQILGSRNIGAEVVKGLNLQKHPVFLGQMPGEGFVASLWSSVSGSVSEMFSKSPNLQVGSINGVPAKVIEIYRRKLEIAPVRGTRLVKVGFTTRDRELSAQIANAHARAYIRQGLELHSSINQEAQEFLESKLVELKERVEKSEAALNAYRREKGIISLTDKENIIVERLDELNKDVTAAEAERIATEAQEQLIRKRDYGSLPAVIGNDLIQKLKEQLAGLEGEEAKVAAKFKAGFPALDQVHAQVAQTRVRLESEIRKVVGGIESAYMAAVSRENQLRARMEEQKELALSQKDAGVQYGILAREVDTNRQLYDSVLQRMKETGVAAQDRASNVFMIEQAVPPRKPSSPRRVQDVVISALGGLIIGLGLAFVVESLDNTLKNPEEVERVLHLPTLAVIPDFASIAGTPYAPKLGVSGPNGEVRRIHSTEVISARSRFSPISEAYRTLRTAIMLSRAGEPPKITLVTSALQSEGKTVTAINTAVLFAHTGGKVLLVDADLRRPRCHTVLRMENGVGLTEVLTGQLSLQDAIRPTSIESLFLLPSGATPPNPAELLGSTAMKHLLGQLSQEYSFVVIDSAPTMLVSDSLPLSTMVDGVLLVVNGPKSPKHLIEQACSRLRYVGAKIMGIVLNQVDLGSPDYYYSHYYYSYRNYSPYDSREGEAEAGGRA